MTRRLWVTLAAVAVLLASCGSSTPKPTSGPRPLTEAQADRLAVTRFLNYQAGGVGFSTSIPSSTGTVVLHGSVDYRTATGDSAAQISGASGVENDVFEWSASTVTAWFHVGNGTTAPTARPPGAGQARALDPSTSTFDTVLALLLELGQDRPDNAQLLQQSDAQWLRRDVVDGTPVDVIRGPSSAAATATASPKPAAAAPSTGVLYWIDSRGRLLRLDAMLPGSTVRIEFAGARFTPLSSAAPSGH